ncbi:unnamed protein product [Urochloa humidicola]
MSHHLGRVVSDLSHSNSRGATRHGGLRHQSTATTSNSNGGNKATQKLALLFSGVFTWARKESSAAAEPGSSSRPAKNRRQQEGTNNNNGGGARRWGRLDIVLAVRKYVSMVEQLIFASYSGGSGGSSRDVDGRRRRPHTFTYARGGSAASSKRHKGRLSSAPASLRGSPANSGHLVVGESVMTKKASTSSEVSTMEELHSAIQAAIAHCKSSAAAAGGGDGDARQ